MKSNSFFWCFQIKSSNFNLMGAVSTRNICVYTFNIDMDFIFINEYNFSSNFKLYLQKKNTQIDKEQTFFINLNGLIA
jgi:hypothetical protein